MRTVALVLLLHGTALASTEAAGQFAHPHAAQLDELRAYIAAEQDRWQIPGLSVAVLHRGVEVFRMDRGLANVELGVAVSDSSVFEVGSVSKQFVATAVMLLREDGALGLDDPVHAHLPGLPGAWRGVTIRHLLTHTSGIPDYEAVMGYYAYRERMTADQVTTLAHARPVRFAPGEAYEYSNTGYFLLSLVVEERTGHSLGAFLSDRIFEPLGMSRTRMVTSEGIVPGRVAGYARNGAAQIQNRAPSEASATLGAGGIVSTVGDLARWDRALYDGRVLPAAVLDEMWTPGRLNDGTTTPYGFGWRVEPYDGRREQYHYGMTAGFVANVTRLPDDGATVVVLGNRYEGRINRIVVGLLHAFVPSLGPSGMEGAPR